MKPLHSIIKQEARGEIVETYDTKGNYSIFSGNGEID